MATNIGGSFDPLRSGVRAYQAYKTKDAPIKNDKPQDPGDIKDTVEISTPKVTAEESLSDKAKELLGNLRSQYGDYGFAVAGSDAEFSTMRGVGDKEYTVIFTADELEKMAEDDAYATEQMKQVESLIDMTKKLEDDEEFQAKLDELAEKGYILSNLSLTVNEQGGVDIFAELVKVSEKQAERIEERRAENKAMDKAEQERMEKEAIAKKFEAPAPPKKGIIKASSMEDLMNTIGGLDDEGLNAIVSKPIARIDFSV